MTIRIIPTEQYFELVRTQLAVNSQAQVRVTGNSMLPLLQHGRDSVVIVPCETIKVGDVVLFDRKNGRYALHRVIRTNMRHFDMMGDNQWHMEKNLPMDQVLGKVSCFCREEKNYLATGWKMHFYSKCAILLAKLRWFIYRISRILRLTKY